MCYVRMPAKKTSTDMTKTKRLTNEISFIRSLGVTGDRYSDLNTLFNTPPKTSSLYLAFINASVEF